MLSKYPHYIGVNVSKTTFKALQSQLDRWNNNNMQKLVRDILDIYAEMVNDEDLKNMSDKLNKLADKI